MTWVYDDGGRAASGRRGTAGDCVVRAIAIAGRLDYGVVYDELAARAAATGKPRSARDGLFPKVYKPYLAELGFEWTPTMSIGSGCRVHAVAYEGLRTRLRRRVGDLRRLVHPEPLKASLGDGRRRNPRYPRPEPRRDTLRLRLLEGAGALIPVAFDIPSMRPACVLVAASLGGSPEAAKRFPPETWLLAPTPTMGV